MSPEGATRIAQAAFKPITWSPKDTAPTVQQIKIHNAVGVKLGLWKYPPTKSRLWFRRKVAVKPVAAAPLPTNKPELNAPAPKKHWWQRKKKPPAT